MSTQYPEIANLLSRYERQGLGSAGVCSRPDPGSPSVENKRMSLRGDSDTSRPLEKTERGKNMTITAHEFIKKLHHLGACDHAMAWINAQPTQDPLTLWQTCQNGWWMLWWLEENDFQVGDVLIVYRLERERRIQIAAAEMDAAGVPHTLRKIPPICEYLDWLAAQSAMRDYHDWKHLRRIEAEREATSEEEAAKVRDSFFAEQRKTDTGIYQLMADACRQHLTDLFMRTMNTAK